MYPLPNGYGQAGVKDEACVPEELERLLDPPLQEVAHRRPLLVVLGHGRRRLRVVTEGLQRSLKYHNTRITLQRPEAAWVLLI